MKQSSYLCNISRKQLESLDVSPVTNLIFAIESNPKSIQYFEGTLDILPEPKQSQNDYTEICLDPAYRSYVAKLFSEIPHLLFYVSLSGKSLHPIGYALLNDISLTVVDGHSSVQATFSGKSAVVAWDPLISNAGEFAHENGHTDKQSNALRLHILDALMN